VGVEYYGPIAPIEAFGVRLLIRLTGLDVQQYWSERDGRWIVLWLGLWGPPAQTERPESEGGT